jgi:DNA repair protein SbcC/Rad50
MRPHRLRVQAFGAFAGTEEVSFDDLEGLFLLHGETGAGKTTLLDAIAFALYGRVPGERGSVKRLRSDHAAPGLATEVELEATIGGRHLRITRKPEQERPKKSGAGVTREQAAVRLDERTASGSWESKSVRVVEADQEIRDLMGMSAEQFFQVVLLPQGQFARFLHASAQDKEALLQKLFSTDRFRAVERWLADRRLSIEKEVAGKTGDLGVLIAQVAQAADVSAPDSASDQDAAGWVAALAANALAAQEQAAVQVAALSLELEGALAAKSEAEQVAGRQRRRRDALRRQRELHDAAPVISALRAEADAALRAAQVKADLDAADRAATAAARALTAEARARALIADGSDTGIGEMPGDATAETLHAAAEEQRTQLGRLDGLRAVARQAIDEDKIATAARSRAVAIDADLTAAEAAVASREQARPQAVRGRDAAGQAAAELPAARAAADAAGRMAADADTLVQERANRDRLHEAHLAAREKAVETRTKALTVREARIDGMRAELAATMTDGSPCPVCGSLDHPDPVEPTFEPVSRDTEDAANALADQATAKADKAGQDVAAADGRIGELAQRLRQEGFGPLETANAADAAGLADAARLANAADATDPAAASAAALRADPASLTAAARQADADARLLEAEAAGLAAQAAALPSRQRELDALDDAIAAGNARRAELTEQRKAAEAESESAEQRAAQRRAELAAQLGGAVDLDTAINAARRRSELLAAAAEAVAETVRTAAEAAVAADRAHRAATDAGFAGPTDIAPGRPAPAAEAPRQEPPGEAISGQAIPAQATPAGSGSGESAVAAARAALRDHGWRADAAGRVGRHETEMATVAAQLADPDLAVDVDPAAPVAETADAAAVAREAHDAANGAYATARHTAGKLALLAPKLKEAITALAPLRDRADQIRQIAELANGNGANRYRMTLSSFVLAARLEEVAQAASERLLTMTAGRYSLAHSDARKGNAKAGLSLLACDSWTGVDRDTATLSGGETFLASLALALGLADVVTAEAAGTPMEALFVDEGFGTLDEETLDEVMNVLDGLRAGGRIVGIVSHVTELRQRIPAQVHVAKGRHGSHVRVSVG